MNANVEQGTVKELLMLFTQEGAATYKATLLLMPTAFSPGCSEGAGAQRPLVCSKGAVDHCIVRRHANTDINPETSEQAPSLQDQQDSMGSKECSGGKFDEAEVWGREVERGAD